MSGGDVLLLLGVFLGGAAPWLEAIVVIPIGIVAGLNPILVVLVGVAGNLLTVWVAAFYGERIRTWWQARRARRRAERGETVPHHRQRRRERIERLLRRWGMPALAALGPIGLGTQVSALVAVGLGVSARASFVWIGAGTVVWSIVAAVAAVTGLSIAGVGA
ncbi:small multi-drug export protein [Natronosporangium hydrolyticum]|uniref:Small multi-drug export protein n=1 Tax=Natronosporangium hydrolyticum TaxID=2811111 RepID=A0A895Y7P8_9ACTN|nr:small multi-drug export protein [Natronosporangium hydrolyticum]QSB13381.1 small multi-drug export protein [Natronosporangium hydrolyticum]